jgi:predicted GNAT superfamily acetyltransferase
MSQAQPPSEIEIRHCVSTRDYDECVCVEKAIWGESLAVPVTMFVVARETGGQVIGAFAGAQMVGFALAYVGVRRGDVFLHSHITAVLPEFRDHGIGRRLKLFQREDAISRGIDRVEWTFDPLELKNAHFNLVRLGAVARHFIPNCYGITDSPLHSGLPTDRLVAEWVLASERVKSILDGQPPPIAKLAARISVPANFGELRKTDPSRAQTIQSQVRDEFIKYFRQGYVATAVVPNGSTVEYRLEPATAIKGAHLLAREEN